MPAAGRLPLRRRRSSLSLTAFQPAKAGIYGISRPVTFAPNVTPISYHDDSDSPSTSDPGSPSSGSPADAAPLAIFPPSETPAPPPARRRCPPGKRRSLGYIPRPPNAFMLFRADFVRQKHVPGTIETNHGSLSKIIGNCWRALPLEEKKIWEVKAKHAKTEHKIRYPEYRFKPVHNKNKNKDKKEKPPTTVEDERRCEEVAQLLLEGKKGDELAAAVRSLDLRRSPQELQQQLFDLPRHHYHSRRPSSVPLPNEYYPQFPFTTPTLTLPIAPFLSTAFNTDAPSSFRNSLGARRPSSAGPYPTRSWTFPTDIVVPDSLQRDDSPLPDVNSSLFDPSFRLGSTFPVFDNRVLSSSDGGSFEASLAPHDVQHLFSSPPTCTASDIDPLSWMGADPSMQDLFQIQTQGHVHEHQHYHIPPTPSSSSGYSPSPPPSIAILPLPPTAGMKVFAPKPQSATSATFPPDLELWKQFDPTTLGLDFTHQGMDMEMMNVDLTAGYPKTSFDAAMQALGALGGVGVGPGDSGLQMVGDDAFGMDMEFDPSTMGMF